jgi:hypothetical protein
MNIVSGESITSYSQIPDQHKFSQIEPLLYKLTDPMLAIRTIESIAEAYPCGPERISAFRTGCAIAEQWQQTSAGSEATTELGKLNDLLACAETEHQLVLSNLSELLPKLHQPSELVRELYDCYAQKTRDRSCKFYVGFKATMCAYT